MDNYLIVGGSSGIGRAIVERLNTAGAQVWATYNKNAKEDFDNVHYHHLDVLSEDWNIDFIPDTLAGVVYCPGSINLKPFTRFKDEDYLKDYRLQVVGATHVLRQCLPALKKSKQGAVVLFSTVAVQMGFPFHAQVSASKGAIEGLTRALAAELAPHVRVNAIAPSLTQTPLAGRLLSTEEKVKAHADKNPLQRVGAPEDIATAANYLLREGTWITGQVMAVDGGFSSIKG